MKKLTMSLIVVAVVLAVVGCSSKVETSDGVTTFRSQEKSSSVTLIVSTTSDEELNIDSYKSIAAELEDWQELFVDDNIKIYQSISQSSLFKYEIILRDSTIIGYGYITSPEIEYLTTDVIKISRSLGSNLASVQYFKLAGGKVENVSEEFLTYGYSTEYISSDDMLVAYTGSVGRGDTEEIAVIVRDIFNGSEKASVIRDYYALAEVVESMEFSDGDTLKIVYKQCELDAQGGYKTVSENIKLD